ncbi:hypothetical protein AhyVDH1_010 [Aeromonas phage AhyVDH1]|nr:hypothetical protein AhyVDH1_010 [Aeromonas phage AhyVDH1]
MNDIVEIADAVLSPEAIGLVVGLVSSGVGAPVAIGSAVVVGIAAAILPKEKTKALMNSLKAVIGIKPKL